MTKRSQLLGAPVVVGRITAPYGVKGWVKVHSYTTPVDNIVHYRPLYLQGGRSGADWETLNLDRLTAHGKGFIAHVAGCDDRNQAELLVRRDIACSADCLPKLADHEYYWGELEGLRVISRWQGVDTVLGVVARMTETGANDVMIVRGDEHSADQRERWVPWVQDDVVLEVDRDQGCIVVAWDPEF